MKTRCCLSLVLLDSLSRFSAIRFLHRSSPVDCGCAQLGFLHMYPLMFEVLVFPLWQSNEKGQAQFKKKKKGDKSREEFKHKFSN